MGPALNGYTDPMETSVKAALSEAEIEQLASSVAPQLSRFRELPQPLLQF
jgi:hypothetical protein